MLESLQSNKFEYKRIPIEEQKERGILGRLIGCIADFKNPTRNERFYSESLWDKVFENPIMQERIKNKVCFGELQHPADREDIDPEKVAVCLAEVPKKGKDGKLYGVFDILSTPNGRILKSFCDYGCTVGISSRGTGDLYTDDNGNEAVDPDTYECVGWDVVLIPAVESARLQYVTESLDTKRYNKTLRQKLTEELDRASENDRKIMKEALEGLNIKLNESSNIVSRATDKDGDEWIIVRDEDGTYNIVDPDTGDVEEFGLESLDAAISEVKSMKSLNENEHLAEAKSDLYEVNVYFDEKVAESVDNLPIQEAIKKAKEFVKAYEGAEKECDVEIRYQDDNGDPLAIWTNVISYGKDKEGLNDTLELADADKSIAGLLNEKLDLSDEEEFEVFDDLTHEFYSSINNVIDRVLHKYSSTIRDTDKEDIEIAIEQALTRVFDGNINEECNSENCADIEEENEEEVVNDKSDALVEELQDTLLQNKKLMKDNLSLQEKLSVCTAKEVKLEEELKRHRAALVKVSDKAKKVNSLKEELTKLEESLAKKDELLNTNKQIVESVTKEKDELAEKLNESLSKVEQLQEDLLNSNSFKEDLDKCKSKLNQYKKAYVSLKEKYISVKSFALDIDKESVKANLNESYSIKDIDRVCEKLATQKKAINKLPIKLNENTKITVKKSTNEIGDRFSNDDDDVSSLLRLL